MKVQLSRESQIEKTDGLIKYSTNVYNVYIYDVQVGWNYSKSIIKDQKDKSSNTPIAGEQSIIITHSDFINNQPAGPILKITYTRGLKTKFSLGEKFHAAKSVHHKNYYTIQ